MATNKTNNLTGAIRDKILFDVTVLGVSPADEAKALGIVVQSVNATLQTFNLVKAGDWFGINEVYRTNKRGINCLEWAIARTNATPPIGFVEELTAIQKNLRFGQSKPADPEPEKPELPDPTPNDALVWVKVLEGLSGLLKGQAALIEAVEELAGEMRDALSALASDLKDNANVNGDLVCQRLKEANDTLNGIKMNTRRKGA